MANDIFINFLAFIAAIDRYTVHRYILHKTWLHHQVSWDRSQAVVTKVCKMDEMRERLQSDKHMDMLNSL